MTEVTKDIEDQFKQADDFHIICNHPNAVLADEGVFSLGEVNLWLCMACLDRIRAKIVVDMLARAAAVQFGVDGELRQMLKDNAAAQAKLREGYEGQEG